jgi:hypothetical protein
MFLCATFAAVCGFLSLAQAQTPMDPGLRLNQIQVIGTHNSYHAGIAPSESQIWQAKNPEAYMSLDYQHQPLSKQLDFRSGDGGRGASSA